MPLFADLDRLRADLDALRPLAPEQEARVLQKFRLEWNYNSNAIEGNSLTLGETRSLLLHGLTAAGKPMRDHLDIKGHNEAVLWLEDFVRDDRPLTEQFIRGMHEVLLGEPFFAPAQTAGGQPMRKMITPGQYKRQPNNVLTATGEMFYFASPEETPGRMTDLVDWYRAEEAAPTMHPVALAAEFHYRFVRIHPFDDGNGRMSRLLMNLILLRHGYPMTVIQAADRNRYLAALAEADAGEPEPFLRFIIENVEAGLRLMIRAARGESIDEPSDLDKKLALLKKQIIDFDTVTAPKWDLDMQQNFYDYILDFWLSDLTEQTTRFDYFFWEKEFSFMIFYKGFSPGFTADKTFEPVKYFAAQLLKSSSSNPYSLSYIINWNAFKKQSTNFNLELRLDFVFDINHFTVSNSIKYPEQTPTSDTKVERPEKIFNSSYYIEYNTTQIHEINYQLANKVYDFIAAKLAEGDTPPA